MKKIVFLILLTTLSSCVQQSKYEKALATIDSLQTVNKALTQQCDDLLNGEERLIKLIELYNTEQNYIKAYDSYNALKARHPESKYIIVNQNMLSSIESKAFIIMDSINNAKKDSVRLANIKDLGIWKLGDYTNDFDEPTGEKYVYTDILGRFSNIATSSSSLRVNILINQKGRYINAADNTPEMTIRFDEYNNGVYEEIGIHSYKISSFKIVNKAARKVYKTSANILLEEEEGIYECYISYDDGTKYEFSIDTKYLNNAIIKAGMKSIFESKIENKQ